MELQIEKLDAGIKLSLSKENRDELKEYLLADSVNEFSWETEYELWYDLFEPYSTNGSYTPVSPEDVGAALTSDPYLIADCVDIEDDGTLNIIGDIYYCPDYQVLSLLTQLYKHGEYFMPRAN